MTTWSHVAWSRWPHLIVGGQKYIKNHPRLEDLDDSIQKEQKTINNEDSLLVTDATTNSSACGLSTAERTGSPVVRILWSIAKVNVPVLYICLEKKGLKVPHALQRLSTKLFAVDLLQPQVKRAPRGTLNEDTVPSDGESLPPSPNAYSKQLYRIFYIHS